MKSCRIRASASITSTAIPAGHDDPRVWQMAAKSDGGARQWYSDGRWFQNADAVPEPDRFSGRLRSEASWRSSRNPARGHLQPVRSADRAELRYVDVTDIWWWSESELRPAHIRDPVGAADSGAEANQSRRAIHVLRQGRFLPTGELAGSH